MRIKEQSSTLCNGCHGGMIGTVCPHCEYPCWSNPCPQCSALARKDWTGSGPGSPRRS